LNSTRVAIVCWATNATLSDWIFIGRRCLAISISAITRLIEHCEYRREHILTIPQRIQGDIAGTCRVMNAKLCAMSVEVAARQPDLSDRMPGNSTAISQRNSTVINAEWPCQRSQPKSHSADASRRQE